MQENKSIEEILVETPEVPMPSSQMETDIPNKEVAESMRVRKMQGAGWVYVWDNRTGERSIISRTMLPTQLKKKREDGSRVFTTVDPKIPVRRGSLKCMLHRKDPDRTHYDELGLPYCRKENLTSPYMRRRHMEKRHPQEWATIKEEIDRKEKDRDRELRERLLTTTAKVEEPKKAGRPRKS